ncbi:MAG: oxygen-independent coproporphyrinogen III oxidase [Pseudomonadota bacterium]
MVATAELEVPSLALIERYGITGPRFTSYPTALSFDEAVGETQFLEAIARSNDALIPAPLALYLHIPFCRSLCYYCGCHKKVTRNLSVVQQYLTAMHKEIALKGELFDSDRVVNQLHFGGGTPTYLNAGQRKALIECLNKHFDLSSADERDFSIEIDPRTMTPAEMHGLAKLGFNRVSFGIQDFDPAVQKAVNREQRYSEVEALVRAARDAGFQSVSVDLIYGLPNQTTASFAKTVEQVVALRPDAMSVFNYAHLPDRFPAQRLISTEDLPDAATRIQIFRDSAEQLGKAGYDYIGMDHFALPDSYLGLAKRAGKLHRCFQGYATGAGNETVGFGVSAISHVGDGYFQVRKDLPHYLTDIEHGKLAVARGYVTDRDDRRIASVIQALMCHAVCRKAHWEAEFKLPFDPFFAGEIKKLRPLVDDGLVIEDAKEISVTPLGVAFLRTIAGCFDRSHIPRKTQCSSNV